MVPIKSKHLTSKQIILSQNFLNLSIKLLCTKLTLLHKFSILTTSKFTFYLLLLLFTIFVLLLYFLIKVYTNIYTGPFKIFNNTMRSVKLNYHIPTTDQITSFTSGLRPYRSQGIRLEKEVVGNKDIYHDYGHGGGGLSLGWGCAKYIIQNHFLPSKPDLNKPVAVLGAGIIGLSTALQLVDLGYTVNLYANNFAYDTKGKHPEITTTVAAGLWMPVKITSKTSLQDLSKSTLDHLYEVKELQEKQKKKYGIEEMDIFIVNDKEAELYPSVKGIIPYQEIKVTFGGQQLYDAVVFKTLIIQTLFYIPYLMDRLTKSGRFQVFQRSFESFEQVKKLQETSIFNCLGLAGNTLFEDPSPMKPIKGHIVKLTPNPRVMDHALFLKAGDRWILQIPHRQSGKLNLGISFQENNWNPFVEKEAIDLLIKTSRNYFGRIQEQITRRPKL